jgi:hypothetical protein
LRDSWEKERGFPAQLVNHLRPYLLEAGLHFFKHRKRILYISAIKPMRIAAGQDLAGNLAAIIAAVEAQPKLTRRDLAAKILGEHHEAPEMLEQKAQLARDLHYLVHAGHVIEFHDGTLDLPLPPGGQQPQGQQQQQPAKAAAKANVPQTAEPAAVLETAESFENAGGEPGEETLVEAPVEPVATSAALVSEEAISESSPAGSEISMPLSSPSDLAAELPPVNEENLAPAIAEATIEQSAPVLISSAGSETVHTVTADAPLEIHAGEAAVQDLGAAELVAATPAPVDEIRGDATQTGPAPALASEVTDALRAE